MGNIQHGANGEFMAAGWLLEELGLAAGSYDVQMVAQVIAYAARDSQTDTEAASKVLLASAKSAINAGEVVNVFWFKDRRFAQPRQATPRIDQAQADRYEESARKAEEWNNRWCNANEEERAQMRQEKAANQWP
jgi:hypothetical protein